MKFSVNYTVNNLDTDCNRILSLSGIMRYMQDTAFHHMEQVSPSYEELFSQGKAFYINRLTLSSYTPVHSHDKIESQTWTVKSSGLAFTRCFRILLNGEIAAEAVTQWSLYNFNERKFIKVSDFPADYGDDLMPELDCPKRVKIPEGLDLPLVSEYTVAYRDCDMNMHMNNTVYGDLFCGYIPNIIGKRIIKFDINFRNGAPLGEKIKLYLKNTGDGIFYIRSTIDTKPNTEALIMVEEI